MPDSLLDVPLLDPAPIADLYRGNYATELLVAAIAHLKLFEQLAAGPISWDALKARVGLKERPAVVLLAALRAMKLVHRNEQSLFELTEISREHLIPGGKFYFGDYVALAAGRPGVLEMVDRLRTDRPADHSAAGPGAAFIFRAGLDSAMEAPDTARHFTLGLAGRALNVAPALAVAVDLATARHVLDVAGGTGLYSIALLQKNPHLRATVFDRPEVLKIASEMAERFGVTDRLTLTPGDMFTDPLPPSDTILLSNVLHDWDLPTCQDLVTRCAAALSPGGKLLIHDVLLNDALDGPLPVTLYSAALFVETEGRAYSAAEYQAMAARANLRLTDHRPTLVNCSVLTFA